MLNNKLLTILILFAGFYMSAHADNSLNEVIPVTIKPLEQLVFHPVKKVPAQVISLQRSLLSSEVSALVASVHVQSGDRVVKGQLLITLECDDYELNKRELSAQKLALEADYDFARYQLQHSKKLLKTRSVSEEAHRRQLAEVNRLSAQKQMLEIKILQSEKMISRCDIKAPFAGVIAKRLIDIGEKVISGTPLLQLIDVLNLEVEVQVPIVLVDDLDYTALNFIYRNQAYPLKLRSIVPSIEMRARHQRVRLSFTTHKTLPGAYGMVEITMRKRLVSASYLVQRDGQLGLFIVKENPAKSSRDKHWIAHFYALKDALPGRAATVELPLNTQVIIAGRHALSDGQEVVLQQ